MKKPLRILIVDDTAIYRKILSDAAASIDGLEVVDIAPRGNIALEKLKTKKVDLVFLDIFMPEMDGLETLEHIRKDYPHIHVVMISGATTRDTHITIKALEMGALEFIPKPKSSSFQSSMPILIDEMKRVVSSIGVSVGTRKASPPPAAKRPSTHLSTKSKLSSLSKKFGLLVIGVSTGGPKALSHVIPNLPADLACPVLIVQHMPPLFTASLAENLDKSSALSVREAKDGEPICAGDVLIAPGGKHMVLRSNSITGPAPWSVKINEDPPVNSCRPAVDVLFKSAANVAKTDILAVILTGMGEDGANGVEALKEKSCYCLSQNQATCVVYGMPQAVESRGLADEVLPLDTIALRITKLINSR